jgi:hypothetical protein
MPDTFHTLPSSPIFCYLTDERMGYEESAWAEGDRDLMELLTAGHDAP